MASFLLYAHKTIGDKRATPKLTSTYPLTELWSMFGASTEIVKIGLLHKQAVCMTMILGISQIAYNWTLRVSRGCKSSL